MASKRIWLLGLIAVVFATVAVLVWSFAHHRGGLALRSQPVVSRYAVHVTDKTLQRKVIEASLPVLVMFHAPWCQPCHQMMPTLDVVAEGFEGKMKFVLINGDEQEFCRQKYSIDQYPTIVIFNSGEEVFRQVGLIDQRELTRRIEAVIRDFEVRYTSKRESTL